MSRYTGPRLKKMRALGVNLPGLSMKSIENRPYPPGQHGQGRRKLSDYALQLREKQKLRLNYGLSERQLRRLIKESRRSKMATDAKLIELLERRLDNVVFRAGFAPTVPAARQLINHGHIRLDGRRADVCSIRVSSGQTIQFRNRSQSLASVTEALQSHGPYRPDWLQVDEQKRTIVMQDLPTAETVLFPIELQLVVEYYSKRL
jgi:small subunit ribosomal protein S4